MPRRYEVNPTDAALAAFGSGVLIERADDRPGEYDVHASFDPAIHLDDGDTYLGTVYRERGAWMAVARLVPFNPSATNRPPVSYDGMVGEPYPIVVQRDEQCIRCHTPLTNNDPATTTLGPRCARCW
jgi:hypothetical protein